MARNSSAKGVVPAPARKPAKGTTPAALKPDDLPTAEREPNRQLHLIVEKGGSVLDAAAAQAQDPITRAAAMSTGGLLKPIFGAIDLMGSVRALQASVAEVQSGDLKQADAMLVAQANTLDAVFAECLRMWMANQFTNHGPSQEYLRMAMKAQSQARATWESISKIHHPATPATFVRQANIANGPQQVNNGADFTPPIDKQSMDIKPARETENPPIELKALNGGSGHGVD